MCFYPFCFAEHLDPINVKIAELREALESVTAEQKYLRARDYRHRRSKSLYSLSEDINIFGSNMFRGTQFFNDVCLVQVVKQLLY